MNNKLMLYFFLSVFSHFSAVTPARSNILGAKIDINLESCKLFSVFFRKKPKKLRRTQRSSVISTFLTRFLILYSNFSS